MATEQEIDNQIEILEKLKIEIDKVSQKACEDFEFEARLARLRHEIAITNILTK